MKIEMANGVQQRTPLLLHSRMAGNRNKCMPCCARGTEQFHAQAEQVGRYLSVPLPPHDLWDTDELAFLEKVKCHANIRLICIYPKNGFFKLKMKCHWSFRTLNTDDKTEPKLRVPGIRMPGLQVEVEESRIWRDLKMSTGKTVFWQGLSIFTMEGYEIFELEDFPFDRQIVNLELLEFVWRPEKDADTYDFAMKVVAFNLDSSSMLPEWTPYPAIVHPEKVLAPGCGPSFASRFRVQLRLQRESWFYVVQVFLVTSLITISSCFPLAMPPTEDHIGDRLSLYGGGCLTLVAFKYGIADHLPCVPYSTFTDVFLLWQVITLIALAVETIIVYRVVNVENETYFDKFENSLLAALILAWGIWFVYVALLKRRRPWNWTLEHQFKSVERLRTQVGSPSQVLPSERQRAHNELTSGSSWGDGGIA